MDSIAVELIVTVLSEPAAKAIVAETVRLDAGNLMVWAVLFADVLSWIVVAFDEALDNVIEIPCWELVVLAYTESKVVFPLPQLATDSSTSPR